MNTVTEVFGSGGFANRVTVYVPSTTDIDKALDANTAEYYVNLTLEALSNEFGGATAISAKGGFVENGRLVVENVTLVYSFTDNLTTEKLQVVKQFCERLKGELRQVTIGLEVNGSLLFV